MKKNIYIFLTITLLILVVSSAYAEDKTVGFIQLNEFMLRNEISFGMKMDEVEKRETLSPTGKLKRILQVKGNVDDYSNIVIHYDFDEDGKLYNVYFAFDENALISLDKVNSEYLDVRSQLIDKYGEPIALSNGEHYIVSGEGIKAFQMFYDIGQLGVQLIDDKFVSAYDEWVIVLPEGYVKIEHFACCTEGIRNGKKDVSGQHYLYYQYFTKKTWDIALHGLK